MPAVMPVSVVSSPMRSRDTSAAASSNETSVKTAMWLERILEGEDAPDAFSGRTTLRTCAVGHVAPLDGGKNLVALHALGGNGDALRLAAHLQFFDAGGIVFDHGVLDLGFAVFFGRRCLGRLLRCRSFLRKGGEAQGAQQCEGGNEGTGGGHAGDFR